MIAINHALTGALIGLSIGHPAALPLAFASHFVLDSIPHYGNEENVSIGSRRFAAQLTLDMILCALMVLVLAIAGPANWMLAAACAFLAASPDFMWMPRFLRARNGKKESKSKNIALRFHSWIQWFQKPIGALVEAVWLVGAAVLLANII